MNTCQQISGQNATDRHELEMLTLIVDAMLDSQSQLRSASESQWRRILVDSCRRQRDNRSQNPARLPSIIAA